MERKFAGRITLILAVIFVSLLGIYPPSRLFDSSLPWSKKHNLKPGIDIKGGTSLLYEIKPPSAGAVSDELSQNLADALKKRVDPQGVRNLIWRPQGPTRLEIQIPATEGSEQAGTLRKAFSETQEQLSRTNIRIAEVRAALALNDPAQRKAKLDELAMGSPVRAALFAKLEQARKELTAAEQANDPIRKVDAREEVAKLDEQIEQTNLPVARLQSELELIQAAIDKAQQSRNKTTLEQKRKERQALIDKFKAQADFAARHQAIDNFVAGYDAYNSVKSVVGDAEDLKRLLRGSGVLEFHIQVTDPQLVQTATERLKAEGPTPRKGESEAMRWYEVDRPEEFKERTVQYGDKHWMLLYTSPEHSMVHKENARPWGLQNAYRDFDSQSGRTVVGFTFDAQGSVLFGELTGTHIDQPLAIVLDDKIISAPNINSRIEGRGIITGSFSDQDIDYLVRTLNAGSLPARLEDEPIFEHTIGPALGADNLRAGFRSAIAGIVVVTVFMVGYYYFAGIVAVIAVLMNLLVIMGVMAMFDATFTLPGIAGIVLTIGMAVDANVLIYERLREEQLRGLSLRMALRNAYDRAFSAILDSNLTTIATSLILYYFGSEEVKGFGLTLAIGIASSLFTSLFVTRTIFDFCLDKLQFKHLGSLPLSFPKWDEMMKPNIDWMGKAWMFYAFSSVIIVIGLIAYFAKGREMYDVEFVSGTAVQVELNKPTSQQGVRDLVEKEQFKKALPSPQVVAIRDPHALEDTNYEIITPNQDTAAVRKAVVQALGGILKVERPSTFNQSKEPFETASAQSAVIPITGEINIDGFVPASTRSYMGGLAIVLKNISPELSPEQIRDRIRRARLEPGANIPFRPMSVESPNRDPNKPTSLAVVLVSDEGLDYAKDPAAWEEQLARPTWKLVTSAVGREAELRRVTSFNPQVAGDMKFNALVAIAFSIVAIALYVWIRFGNLKFGSATVVALVHDVLMVVGVIGLSHYIGETAFGKALLIEPFRVNLTLVAALLTVMGYSVNDTIVVFDRIRENRGKFGHMDRQVINDSINQTFSRTMLTGGTTMVTLFVMYIWGGAGIHAFTFALLGGILVGTYSSIAIASPILLLGGTEKKVASDQRKLPVGQAPRPVGP